ncbi:unnamed protein product, partial [Polarella glacialis]
LLVMPRVGDSEVVAEFLEVPLRQDPSAEELGAAAADAVASATAALCHGCRSFCRRLVSVIRASPRDQPSGDAFGTECSTLDQTSGPQNRWSDILERHRERRTRSRSGSSDSSLCSSLREPRLDAPLAPAIASPPARELRVPANAKLVEWK